MPSTPPNLLPPIIAGEDARDPAFARLQAQLAWYDRLATRSRRWFTMIKVIALLVAAAIPFLSGFGERLLGSMEQTTLIVGLLGAAIVVAEGLLRLFQWEQHWLSYRATWQALDREKALYLSSAGPYAAVTDLRRLLAERVEDLIGQENQSWVSLHQESRKHGSGGRTD